jgi:hypothetical protein
MLMLTKRWKPLGILLVGESLTKRSYGRDNFFYGPRYNTTVGAPQFIDYGIIDIEDDDEVTKHEI